MPQLAKRFRIKPIPEVENLCRTSKDLYNQTLYELRKKGEEEGVYMIIDKEKFVKKKTK